jgi:outer membrane receptor for ferrienterochelin and colicins
MSRNRILLAGLAFVCWNLCIVTPASATDPPRPAADPIAKESSIFDMDATVVAASLHAQTLEEAPANVTVITEEEIRHFGYRTLGEALSQVRGFYTSYDRAYHYAGVRGFLLPGDYNTRFLVMINGHNMTENVFGSNNFFGHDFGLDLDLVKRIEIIRGPSSTLYGSNGVFATVNVVTKSPAEVQRGSVAIDYGSFGSSKVLGTTSLDLGRGANLLLAGSLFRSNGQNLFFPGFNSPATNFGWANGADGESAYHTFAQLVFRNWTITAYFNAREKAEPDAPYGTAFNQRSAVDRDARDFAEVGWLKETGSATWRWRVFYDRYRFDGRWNIPQESGEEEQNRDYDFGSSIGAQLTYRRELPSGWGALTAGTEFTGALHSRLRNWDLAPTPTVYLDIDMPDRNLAVFLQHEYAISSRWSLQTGMRLDYSWLRGAFASPRVALIDQHSKRTTIKFLYGRAFRDPTTSEQFYEDNGSSQTANPGLTAERGNTIEAVIERKVGHHVSLVGSGYRYWLDGLIMAVPLSDNVVQYQNRGHVTATGVEGEVVTRIAGMEASGSVALQHALDASGERLPNSPSCLVKFGAGRSITKALFGSVAVQNVSQRFTWQPNIAAGFTTVDATLTAALLPQFDVAFGVRNLAGSRYRDPAPFGRIMDTLEQDGRSLFVRLILHSRE